MNAFQTCRNVSDAIPLYLPQQLFLKPIARLNISLQLPQKTMGKNISNWEVMEKLRHMIKPEEFCILKVTKTNLDIIRFEAEIDNKSKLEQIIAKLDNKMIKLKEFPELMRLRACGTKLKFPTRHIWDAYFREAKNMNEMKPGERPDTIHISNLPIKWFVPYHLSEEEDIKPSEKIFYRVFEKFGQIRRVDIPICDPYRSKMKAEVSGMQIFDFREEHFFEGYVQFKDYVAFTKTMEAFCGMKLLRKEDSEVYMVNINVDFDKTKHLSDASACRREIVRERLVKREVEREEKERREKEEEELKKQAERQNEIDEKTAKERRRREREEKRKAKILDKLKVKGADEINEKIAKEEKKLLKVQRKLEAIRLVEELFKRIKTKKEKDLKANSGRNDNEDELTRLKNSSELEVRQQREKLNRVIEGRVVLKSILSGGPRIRSYYDDSSSNSDSSVTTEKLRKKKEKSTTSTEAIPFDPNIHAADAMLSVSDWYGYPSANSLYPYQIPAMYSQLRGHPSGYFPYPRGRGIGRGAIAGPSRGLPNSYTRRLRGRYRGNFRGGKAPVYPPELQEQYYRYFEKFLHDHDDRSHRSYSRDRSRSHSQHKRSRSRSRRKSRNRSHTRSRSYSRHRFRNYKSRSRSPSRSRTRRSPSKSSRSRSRSCSRSRRKSRSYSRRSASRSTKSNRSRHSSKSRHSPPLKRNAKRSSKSCSTSAHRKSKKDRSRSPSYRSIDSSKFISPSRLKMPRSKSWSLPKETDKTNTTRSWSKSASPEKKN